MNAPEIKNQTIKLLRPKVERHLILLRGLLALGLALTPTAPALAGGFSNTGSMNLVRSGPNAFLLDNGEVLVFGGGNSLAAEQSAELYDPARGKWTLIATNLNPKGLFGYNAVLLPDGDVLVAGGSALGGAFTNSAALFNPSTGSWTPTGSMNAARNGFMFFLLPTGKVLAAGGDSLFSEPATAELYDPATGMWTPAGPMPGSYNGYTAVRLGDGEVLADVALITGAGYYLYDPASGSWTPTTSPPPAFGGFAGLLPDGVVWIGGDLLYNPTTAQWTTFAEPTSRGGFAVLASGQVLAAGGTFKVPARPYPIEETLNTAELWDPSTLTWTSTGNLKLSRTGQLMILLSNGQVLVAGGQTFDSSHKRLIPTATAELYTP